MAKGKAQERRVKRLGKLTNKIGSQLFGSATAGQESFLSSIQPEYNQLQGLASQFRTEMNTPFTDTAQGQGFLNVIEQQSQDAQRNLASQSDMLGLSDEAFLSGTQNIARSEQDRMRSLFDMGQQAKVNARQGYGNILSNLIGQKTAGYNTGLSVGQFGMGQARGIQQQAGQMAQGIIGSVVGGASSLAGAGVFEKASSGSDLRLKKNITKVGKSNQGHNVYTFEYIDKEKFGNGLYKGVMAQELESHSVEMYDDGYYRVNYDKIDVNFERIN